MTSKQLKAKVEKLAERIKTRQGELSELKEQQKDLKSQLAEAKNREKAKGK